MSELNKKAFADLIAEDRELLKYYVPRCLERQHIDTVLTDAVINFDKDKRITELKAENQKLWDIVGELQRGGLDLQSLSEGGADTNP